MRRIIAEESQVRCSEQLNAINIIYMQQLGSLYSTDLSPPFSRTCRTGSVERSGIACTDIIDLVFRLHIIVRFVAFPSSNYMNLL